MSKVRRNSGFTLVELLVVIGIIVLLISFILPMVIRARTGAGKARTQADFQTIGIALDAYKLDHGDYPRPDPNFPDTGAAILGKALFGRYGDGLTPSGQNDTSDPISFNPVGYKAGDCVQYNQTYYVMIADPNGTQPPTSDVNYWARFDPRDGADGPGFRSRGGSGKVWPAYVAQGKLNSQGTYFTDMNGGAILYFVARPVKPNLNVAPGTGPAPYVDQATQSLYNANDNFRVFRRLSGSPETDQTVLTRIRMMLGDLNANGYIDNGETPITQAFILWAPGNDGLFGPAGFTPLPGNANASENGRQKGKCDDVMNVQ